MVDSLFGERRDEQRSLARGERPDALVLVERDAEQELAGPGAAPAALAREQLREGHALRLPRTLADDGGCIGLAPGDRALQLGSRESNPVGAGEGLHVLRCLRPRCRCQSRGDRSCIHWDSSLRGLELVSEGPGLTPIGVIAQVSRALRLLPCPGSRSAREERIPSGHQASTHCRDHAPRSSAKSNNFVASRSDPDPGSPETTPSGVGRTANEAQALGRSGKSAITRAMVPRAASRCSRSWVAIRLVRSSAPPGGTAGWIATLV